MFAILFFTVAGFLAGLAYVMNKRKIRPCPILSATIAGLVSLGIWKILKDYSSKAKGKKDFFRRRR